MDLSTNSTTDDTKDSRSKSFTFGLPCLLDDSTENADSSRQNVENFQEIFECEVKLEPLNSLSTVSSMINYILPNEEVCQEPEETIWTTNVLYSSDDELTMLLKDQATASRSSNRSRGKARSRGVSRSRSSSRKSTSRGSSKNRGSSKTRTSSKTRKSRKTRGSSKSRSRSRSARKPSASRRGRRV